MPEFSPLGGLVRAGLRHYNLEKGVKAKQSVSLWERVAGETVAAATHADGIRDGILYVFTRSSAWSQELSMLREALMARVNAEMGEEVVKDIRFQVRRFTKDAETLSELPPPRELTAGDRRVLSDLASRLDGPASDRLGALAAKHMQRGDSRRVCEGCGGPVRDEFTRCPFCR